MPDAGEDARAAAETLAGQGYSAKELERMAGLMLALAQGLEPDRRHISPKLAALLEIVTADTPSATNAGRSTPSGRPALPVHKPVHNKGAAWAVPSAPLSPCLFWCRWWSRRSPASRRRPRGRVVGVALDRGVGAGGACRRRGAGGGQRRAGGAGAGRAAVEPVESVVEMPVEVVVVAPMEEVVVVAVEAAPPPTIERALAGPHAPRGTPCARWVPRWQLHRIPHVRSASAPGRRPLRNAWT